MGYDGRGNLTSSGSSLYSYTSENRLATAPGGATLSYDPTGRLSRVTQGASDTKFEHLGPRLIIERNSAGTIMRRYVHGPGDDEPVVWYEGASLANKRFLHTDERGSVIAVTDATGASIATNKYDEYGIPQSSVGTLAPGTSGRFMYTGQMWIAEVGLYYYKARFYSPTLGRFMQTDPIGYKDGVNWYAYVGNDPVNLSDPSGMEICQGSVEGCDLIRQGAEIVHKVAGIIDPNSSRVDDVASKLGYEGEGQVFVESGTATEAQYNYAGKVVEFNPELITDAARAAEVVGHEVDHSMHDSEYGSLESRDQRLVNEERAYDVQNEISVNIGREPFDSKEMAKKSVEQSCIGSTHRSCK